MNLQQIVAQKHQSPGGEMLLVGKMDILSTMVRLPVVVIGLVLVVLSTPIQQSFASSRTLDFTIYQDGSTHVFYELDVDPLKLEVPVELFGEMIENITIVDEDGLLLSSEIDHNLALIETFGASQLSIDYDTQDLVSKTGKIWTFSIDAVEQYSVVMPKNSVIIEMSNFPISMQVENDQSHLVFPSGKTSISYYISTLASAQPVQQEDDGIGSQLILYIAGIAAAAIITALVIAKRKSRTADSTVIIKDEESKPQIPDPESIFKAKQDLREDDKEIVNFIAANGGQAYESELRKKFLQPRTTMWRAVKRLERQGIIEIEKKDLQNIVKLKSSLEDNS
ncbi:MAG: MarR family transcriptional regulator [Thaumarchaeota archaeon]|nr:MarR family transcriptional regulator [Nitrososphaerota archaeon]